jgi:hypothetical protein
VISLFRKPKKLADFFKHRFRKKAWTIPHEKCHFLLDMAGGSDDKPRLKFYMKTLVLDIYRMMSMMVGF